MKQQDLDKATTALMRVIKFAAKAADDLCEAGDYANSAAMRRVQGHATLAYAEGRTICVACDDGTVIQPLSGTK